MHKNAAKKRMITLLTGVGFLQESIGSLQDFVHCTHPGTPQHGTFTYFHHFQVCNAEVAAGWNPWNGLESGAGCGWGDQNRWYVEEIGLPWVSPPHDIPELLHQQTLPNWVSSDCRHPFICALGFPNLKAQREGMKRSTSEGQETHHFNVLSTAITSNKCNFM